MIEEVKMAFKNNLPHLKWMDDETRAAAVDKVWIFNFLYQTKMVLKVFVDGKIYAAQLIGFVSERFENIAGKGGNAG